MKFKVDRNSDLYNELVKLLDEVKEAKETYVVKIKMLGLPAKFTTSSMNLWGPITSFVFDEMPNGWRQIRFSNGGANYYPKEIKKNEQLLKALNELPVITMVRLKKLLKFKGYAGPAGAGGTVQYTDRPGCCRTKEDDILLSTYDWVADEWERPEGIIEITVTEYNALRAGKELVDG